MTHSATMPRNPQSKPVMRPVSYALLAYLIDSAVTLTRSATGQWQINLRHDRKTLSRTIDTDLVAPLLAHGYLRLARDGSSKVTAAGKQLVGEDSRGRATIDLVLSGEGDDVRMMNLNESPLGWLARRGRAGHEPFLSPHHLQAGERLRADFTFAQMVPRMGANWDAIRSGYRTDGLTLSESVCMARKRVSRALERVGPELSGVLIDVCGHCKGLENIEKERQWPSRAAKVILRLALEALARHYGYSDEAIGFAVTKTRVHHAVSARS